MSNPNIKLIYRRI
ncbi:BgTH12-00853 [Blumeria graminis f. sp. triticale]|uniref:BgTH12-00853 n=1 Tax=Blumeria graminis f. sp. triticale TaxID=1689686 RepID=A0A9W4D7Q9_BLUGR|nr:BgTH12-00853 [Blumeria graminis f. sp. triticale]